MAFRQTNLPASGMPTCLVWETWFPRMQLSAPKKIFANNVMKFADGQMGAANGMTADGHHS